LRRLNAEFDANFDVSQFDHRATYNEDFGRIEMHLISRGDQLVTIAGVPFRVAKDETIRTECSHKYTVQEFGDMVARAGFKVKRVWTDERDLFSVQYCERD
jgi:uncharacterized SAM-dependent methyltransferase